MHGGGLRVRVVGLIAGLLLLCGIAWAQAPALIPPQGLTIPTTTTSLGAAGAMASSCPAGQFLTQVTDTSYTCATPAGGTGSYAPLVNPAGGQNNYAPLASPTFTGTVTMPDASTVTNVGYNNVKSMGIGQAGGGDALDITQNLNAQIGVVVSNNSVGTSAAPVIGWNNGTYNATMGISGTGWTLTGPPTPANTTFIFSNASGGISLNDASTGPINFWVNGTKQGAFTTSGFNAAALTIAGNPLGGTCTSPQFVQVISASGAPTCATPAFTPGAASITDSMLANAYSGVGACTAGQFVSTLNRNAAPTCTTPSAGSFAPLTNPAGGQNNYAPLASPTFTGTVTMPDASTFTSAGHNNAASISITPPSTGGALTITQNQNIQAGISVLNNSTGTSAAPEIGFNNGTYSSTVGTSGTAWTLTGPPTPANTMFIFTNAVGGISLNDSGTGPINFWVNGVKQGAFTTSGLNVAALTIAGAALGGVCGGGTFVSTISAAGVPTCTAPPTQIATPVSVANGGRGSGTAPTAGQIDVAQSGTAFGAVTMSGDATITSSGVLTVSKIAGTTPGGSCTGNQYVLTISSSGVPTCGSLLAPIASPTFTGTVTTPALTVGSNPISVTGTWSPIFVGQSTAGTNTYSTQVGTYVQNGHKVHVEIALWLASTSGMVGNLLIETLPISHAVNNAYGTCGIGQYNGITFTSGYTQLGAWIQSGSNFIALLQNGSGVGAAFLNSASAITGTSGINMSCDFQV